MKTGNSIIPQYHCQPHTDGLYVITVTDTLTDLAIEGTLDDFFPHLYSQSKLSELIIKSTEHLTAQLLLHKSL